MSSEAIGNPVFDAASKEVSEDYERLRNLKYLLLRPRATPWQVWQYLNIHSSLPPALNLSLVPDEQAFTDKYGRTSYGYQKSLRPKEWLKLITDEGLWARVPVWVDDIDKLPEVHPDLDGAVQELWLAAHLDEERVQDMLGRFLKRGAVKKVDSGFFHPVHPWQWIEDLTFPKSYWIKEEYAPKWLFSPFWSGRPVGRPEGRTNPSFDEGLTKQEIEDYNRLGQYYHWFFHPDLTIQSIDYIWGNYLNPKWSASVSTIPRPRATRTPKDWLRYITAEGLWVREPAWADHIDDIPELHPDLQIAVRRLYEEMGGSSFVLVDNAYEILKPFLKVKRKKFRAIFGHIDEPPETILRTITETEGWKPEYRPPWTDVIKKTLPQRRINPVFDEVSGDDTLRNALIEAKKLTWAKYKPDAWDIWELFGKRGLLRLTYNEWTELGQAYAVQHGEPSVDLTVYKIPFEKWLEFIETEQYWRPSRRRNPTFDLDKKETEYDFALLKQLYLFAHQPSITPSTMFSVLYQDNHSALNCTEDEWEEAASRFYPRGLRLKDWLRFVNENELWAREPSWANDIDKIPDLHPDLQKAVDTLYAMGADHWTYLTDAHKLFEPFLKVKRKKFLTLSHHLDERPDTIFRRITAYRWWKKEYEPPYWHIYDMTRKNPTWEEGWFEVGTPDSGREFCPECGESLTWFKSLTGKTYQAICNDCGFKEEVEFERKNPTFFSKEDTEASFPMTLEDGTLIRRKKCEKCGEDMLFVPGLHSYHCENEDCPSDEFIEISDDDLIDTPDEFKGPLVPVGDEQDGDGSIRCGDCGRVLTKESRWSDYTCKTCAEELGLYTPPKKGKGKKNPTFFDKEETQPKFRISKEAWEEIIKSPPSECWMCDEIITKAKSDEQGAYMEPEDVDDDILEHIRQHGASEPHHEVPDKCVGCGQNIDEKNRFACTQLCKSCGTDLYDLGKKVVLARCPLCGEENNTGRICADCIETASEEALKELESYGSGQAEQELAKRERKRRNPDDDEDDEQDEKHHREVQRYIKDLRQKYEKLIGSPPPEDMTLAGIEEAIQSKTPKRYKINPTFYDGDPMNNKDIEDIAKAVSLGLKDEFIHPKDMGKVEKLIRQRLNSLRGIDPTLFNKLNFMDFNDIQVNALRGLASSLIDDIEELDVWPVGLIGTDYYTLEDFLTETLHEEISKKKRRG